MNKPIRFLLCLILCALLLLGTAGCLSEEAPADFSGEAQTLSIGSPVKHYFAQLSQKEKHAYNAILSAVSDFPTSIEVPSLTKEELNRMYTALLYDNPELFFLDNTSNLRLSKKRTFFYPSYLMSAEDYEAMLGKCSAIAEQILNEAREQTTPFARERVVHDRVIARCVYTNARTNLYKNTIYGVLAGGAASCEGYAKTAKYLLDQLGIPCFVLSGNSTPPGSSTQAHMWNIVQIDDAYYHLDLTWDDPISDDGSHLIRHAFFNVTDAQIGKTHTNFEASVACTSDRQNFYVHENLLFDKFDAPEKARAAAYAADMISSGSDGFLLCFQNDEAYRNALRDLFEKEGVYALLKQIDEQTDEPFAIDRVSYVDSDADLTIEFLLETQQQEQGGDDNNGSAEN